MAIVDDAVLAKLEKLSMLEISEDKKEQIKKELEDIVGFVENLNDLDVSNIDATFSTIQGGTPLREDVVVASREIADKILENSNHVHERYFEVPKIIE